MTKHAVAKPLPHAPDPFPEAGATWQEVPVRALAHVRRNVPILDADFDDLVPGYSAADSWYEP